MCNYQTTQTDPNLGRIRIGKKWKFSFRKYSIEDYIGVYVKVELALGNGQGTYVSLDVYYAPTNIWVGQVYYTGVQVVTPPTVVVRKFVSWNTNEKQRIICFREHLLCFHWIHQHNYLI